MEKRKPIRSFEDLIVWQLAIDLVKEIYLITGKGLLKTDFALKDQFRRASISIPTNIAEGFERRSRKEYLLFLNIAKGSAGELRSLLRVALELAILVKLITSRYVRRHRGSAHICQTKCAHLAHRQREPGKRGFPLPLLPSFSFSPFIEISNLFKVLRERYHPARRLLPIEIFIGCVIPVFWQ
jgi:four helix bundle protein